MHIYIYINNQNTAELLEMKKLRNTGFLLLLQPLFYRDQRFTSRQLPSNKILIIYRNETIVKRNLHDKIIYQTGKNKKPWTDLR